MLWASLIPIYATIVVAGVTLAITSRMDLSRYELAIALAAIPGFSVLLATLAFYIGKGFMEKRRLPSDDRVEILRAQLVIIWGQPLSRLHTVITLGEERIKLAQEELTQTLGDDETSLYGLIRIGHKCIQTAKSVHVLCSNGFPDQALSLCRTLIEQETNLWFISTLDNPEEVAQRYFDWEFAKFYRCIKAKGDGLDKRGMGPTKEEWESLTKEYNRLQEKYHESGNLRRREQWAIGTRASGSQHIKAFSVEERARRSRPWLPSDKTQLHDVWMADWQRLSDFTHTTPRSISESASSNSPNVVITGPSSLGINEPLELTGMTVLNISTILTNIARYRSEKNRSRRSEALGQKTVESFRDLMKELEQVPKEAIPSHRRIEPRDQRGEESL